MAREINPRLKNLARMTSNPNASVPDLEEKLDNVEADDIAELRGFIYVPFISKGKIPFRKELVRGSRRTRKERPRDADAETIF